jgi:hypothetical protein
MTPEDEKDELPPGEELVQAKPENPRTRDLPIPVVRVGNVTRSPARFGKVSGKASTKGPGGNRVGARPNAKAWAQRSGKAKKTGE